MSPPPTRPLTIGLEIGRGGYATVYVATCTKTNTEFAVKRFIRSERHDNTDWKRILDVAENEYTLLRNLRYCTRIVRCVGRSGDCIRSLSLILEYVQYTLHTCRCNGNLSSGQKAALSDELLAGVAELHACGVVHRDLKPENVLVTRRGELRIADFGLSRRSGTALLQDDLTGTVWYCAPEVLLHNAIACSEIDVWATGCILAEFWSDGKHPWPAHTAHDQICLLIGQVCRGKAAVFWPGIRNLPGYRWYTYLEKTGSAQEEDVLRKRVRAHLGDFIWADAVSSLVYSLLRVEPAGRASAAAAYKFSREDIDVTRAPTGCANFFNRV